MEKKNFCRSWYKNCLGLQRSLLHMITTNRALHTLSGSDKLDFNYNPVQNHLAVPTRNRRSNCMSSNLRTSDVCNYFLLYIPTLLNPISMPGLNVNSNKAG